MREILFRGKSDIGNLWGYGYLLARYDEYENKSIFIVKENGAKFVVIPETVGQYTGLEDKNGKKIFEGDIVKGVAYSSTFVGAIIWINEIAGFGVRYFNKHRKPTAWENSSILKNIRRNISLEFQAEVIGNIHDNPELLEVGK